MGVRTAGVRYRCAMAGALLLAALGLSVGSARADCADALDALSARLRAGDLAAAQTAVGMVGANRDCAPAQRREARRQLADALVASAAGKPPAEAQALIEAAAAQNASWKASAALGDLRVRAGEFPAAAVAYQQAINLIAAGGEEEIARVPPQTLAQLGRQAGEARHLAASADRGVLVEVPLDLRGNGPGGVYSAVLHRGAEAMRLPAPVLFVYNSAEFTPLGADAAREIATLVREEKPSRVVVVGHTDPIGSEAFNLALSIRRAEALKSFLEGEGVGVPIEAIGKGEAEPRVLSDSAAYTPEQIDALNRRVEFELVP